MKKILCILFAFGLISMSSYAQVASYNFSQASNTFDTLTTGNVIGTTATTAGTYFVVDTTGNTAGSTTITKGIGLPIGFTFTYNGSNFDVFGLNADGWISFGQDSVNMNSSSATAPISATSTATAALQNRVSAFGHSLVAQTGSQLSYTVLGSAPNRILVVEWKKFRRSTTATTDNINFQIKLYETTNVVEFDYGKVIYGGTSSTVQVGLRGITNTDFYNRLGTTTTGWSATTAGTAANSTIPISSTVYPDSGLVFIFTPPAVTPNDAGITAINSPVTPVTIGSNSIAVTIKNFGSVSLTGATIAWSVNGTLQTPYTFANAGLAQYATYGPDTIGTYNFATAGMYVIKAWTESPNGNTDGNNLNDTIIKTVYATGYASLPFSENFDRTWISVMNTHDVPSVYWVNTPATGNNSWRRNDDGTTAGWTSTSGAYTPTGAGTTLHSARFHSRSATAGTTGTLDAYLNFTPNGTKALKFWHINTSGTDTLSVFMSNDGGSTFNLIQKFATVATWTQHFVPLGTSTSANTIIRFGVTNITSGNGQTDVGIDSVQVYLLPQYDAGLIAINAPTTPVSLGSNNVTVTIMNYGAAALTSASIGWSVNGAAQSAYAYTNTTGLATGAMDGPLTIGSYNFSSTGFYTIKAWTSMPDGNADTNNANDTVSKVIYAQPYANLPFLEGFDSTWINKNAIKDVPSIYWSNNPATGNDSWRRNDDTLSAPWTNSAGGTNGFYAPAGADSTIHSARFHTWDAPKGTSGDMDLYLNFTPAGGKQLTFWYMNVDGTDSLSVYLSTDAGVTFNFLQKYLTATTWTADTLYLGNSTSTHCVLRFKTVSDYTNTDIGIDQVKVTLISGALSVGVSATSNTVCAGSADTLSAHSTGGSGAYTYSWTSTPSGFTATSANPVVKPIVNTIYTVIVSDGTSTATNSVAVTVNPLPVVALGKDTSICKNKTITLDAGTGETSYQWSNGKSTETIVVDSTFANASGIATVWAEAINSNGCVSLKDTIVIHFVSCTGINEYNNNASIEMYPNPSTGMTSIAVNGLSNNAELTIYTLEGQLILSKNVTNNSITTLDLTNLSKGIYLVKLYNQETNIMSKLIIQ